MLTNPEKEMTLLVVGFGNSARFFRRPMPKDRKDIQNQKSNKTDEIYFASSQLSPL